MTTRLGLDPYCFGPPGWHFLHSVAAGYPENATGDEIKQHYRQFYYSIEHILPCETCRMNYRKNINTFPIEPYLGTRKDLSYWVYQLHNMVNQETNKKTKISFEEVYAKYTEYALPCDSTNKICGKEEHRQCKIYIKDAMENKNTYMYLNNNKILLLFILFLIVVIIVMAIYLKKKYPKT